MTLHKTRHWHPLWICSECILAMVQTGRDVVFDVLEN